MFKRSMLAVSTVGVVALNNLGPAMAQVGQQVPSIEHSLQCAAAPSAAPMPQTKGPVKRRMPLPAAELPARVSLMPVMLFTYAGMLVNATREDGDITFHYEGGQITQEEIGFSSPIIGRYKYDRHGRFDRIEYSDGMSIIAKYGDNNELLTLSSNNGRSIGFQFADDAIRLVTPTVNPLAFHSVVAVLRMRTMPELLVRPPQEFLKDEDGDSPPIPTVHVPGQRLPDSGPSPIDFIPIGGNGGGSGGGGGGNPLQDGVDFAADMYLKRNCLVGCNVRTALLTRLCETGPTLADQIECHAKVMTHWTNRCQVACLTKDYQHRWQLDFPEPVYAPWRKSKI
jgi:hypothetical protein